ncbi:hypothetical protein HDV00_010134 [Rhizophlyctis rosea]|nr:hypothetical protein HDV00_010134 [Rhizophlyctis rosea]
MDFNSIQEAVEEGELDRLKILIRDLEDAELLMDTGLTGGDGFGGGSMEVGGGGGLEVGGGGEGHGEGDGKAGGRAGGEGGREGEVMCLGCVGEEEGEGLEFDWVIRAALADAAQRIAHVEPVDPEDDGFVEGNYLELFNPPAEISGWFETVGGDVDDM